MQLLTSTLIWLSLFLVQQAYADDSLTDAVSPPFYPTPYGSRTSDAKWQDAYKKAISLVSQMNLAEKVNLTSGVGWEMGRCVGNSGPVPRFNITSLCYQDGPLGVRLTEYNSGFPCGLAAGATFNKDLIYDRGKAMALEHKARGVDVMLGPVVGPLGLKAAGGRNWEGFGADSYLAGVAAEQSVWGIQDQGIMANAKHFIGNEQEHFRQGRKPDTLPISSNIGDRALHETYGWPFMNMIKAGVGSVMCSYNQINNTAACQNSHLLNNVLKLQYGFPGLVVSDWEAMISGVDSVLAGLDVDMPGGGLSADYFGTAPGFSYMAYHLTLGVLNGTIPLDRVDDMATRIMASYYYVGLDNKTEEVNFSSWTLDTDGPIYFGAPDSPVGVINEHTNIQTQFSRNVSLQVALEATILLKNNNGTLPFQLSPVGTTQQPMNAKGTIRSISVLGNAARAPLRGPNEVADRGISDGALGSGWGSGSVNFPYIIDGASAIQKYAFEYGLDYANNFDSYDLDSSAFNLVAQHSDVNVVFASADSGEGYITVDTNLGDRNNFSLWHNADEVILAAAKLNSNNVVVINTVGAVNLEQWIDHPNISAVILTPPQGQDTGEAIAQVLFGLYNPSGRLPFTIAKNDTDYVPVKFTAPDSSEPIAIQDDFDTDIYVDYKLFEKRGITPRYEFGYGLSYSSFELSSIKVSAAGSLSRELPSVQQVSSPVKFPYNSTVPDAAELLYPADIPKYTYYLYPYINSTEQANPTTVFQYPSGYFSSTPTPTNTGAAARLRARNMNESTATQAGYATTVTTISGTVYTTICPVSTPEASPVEYVTTVTTIEGTVYTTVCPATVTPEASPVNYVTTVTTIEGTVYTTVCPSSAGTGNSGSGSGSATESAPQSIPSGQQANPYLSQPNIPISGGAPGGNPALWDTAYTVTVDVKNNGPYDGATVAQLYLGIPDTEQESPAHQLRGFDKVFLKSGADDTLTFNLTRRDVSVWDVTEQSWIFQNGEYKVTLSLAGPNDSSAIETSFTISN